MFIKKSLRNKLIISIFVGCLITYFLGGMYLKKYMDNWLYEDNIKDTDRLLLQIGELIDKSLLEPIEEAVNMLADMDEIKNADGSINNYSEYNSDSFIYRNSNVENEIKKAFANVKICHSNTNFVFLGTQTGGYSEYPQFETNEPYDPRLRPWYINTIDSEGIVISSPYSTQISNETIMSFTKRVVSNNNNIGVVGIAVRIDDLAKNLENIRLGKTGYVIVLNNENKIIISPNNPEWISKTPDEIDINLGKGLLTTNTSFEITLGGEQKIVNTYILSDSEWKVVSIIPKKEITEKSQQVTNILIATYFLTLFLIFVIIISTSKLVTEPILCVARHIDRLAVFDVDFYKQSNIKAFLGRQDEIGIIAKAIERMQKNFVELNQNIYSLDNEINNIDIQKDTNVKLSMSENNPFIGVTKSFNILLEKIHNYFEQLKESNKEIYEKNQLLTTSEEELTAQLNEINSQREFINFLAFHDPLTNLPNRRKFIENLEYALKRKSNGAVLLLDLDNFKGINDTMGHAFGDKVLLGVTKRLETIADDNILVSRFGGDEFLILYEGKNNSSEIEAVVNEINNLFAEKIVIDEHEVEISFSMGISLYPKDSDEVNQLIMNADLALYEVKKTGKNGYKFFDNDMKAHLLRKSNIELVIKDAIENDGFKIVYQPQVNLLTGEIQEYEALLRLKHHNISPADFIPITEENGTIIKIGRIVAHKVIEQLSKWREMGYKVKPISINFSAKQLHDTKFFDFIKDELDKYDIEPQLIEIEITENIFLENKEQTLTFLTKLKEIGIKISIDDFGTGYSSLSYLTFLPIDKIKLDRSLNNKFLELENIKVMDSLILLAHSLNLEVVAEGIETYEQFRRLCVGKCDFIQGYYFSKPLEVTDVEEKFYINYYNN